MQLADATGAVEFHTVYPGGYPGRTIHIHVRAHVGDQQFTSQLYFPEPINEAVLALAPYATRQGRDTTNDGDSIAATGGGPVVLDVTPAGDGHLATTVLVIPTDATFTAAAWRATSNPHAPRGPRSRWAPSGPPSTRASTLRRL